jgi:hypothetical protein
MTIRTLACRGRWIVLVAVALMGATLLTPAIGAQEPETGQEPEAAQELEATPPNEFLPAGAPGSLAVGAGTTTLGEGFPAQFQGDRVLVLVHARTLANQSHRGTFTITHSAPNGRLLAEVRGEITCLAVQGEQAVMTGVVTSTRGTGLPGSDLRAGMAAVIVIRDGGDSDFLAWSFGEMETASRCTNLSAVAVAPVEQGNFVVHD